VFTAQHLLDLAGVYQGLEAIQCLCDVGVKRFALLRPVEQYLQIVALTTE